MPYMVVDKTVYKKNANGRRGAMVGTTKGDVHKYLAALHIHAMGEKKRKSPVAHAIEMKGK